ncbi:MAG TPA: DUF2911 domain-containing protein [Terriglobales bacterium]
MRKSVVVAIVVLLFTSFSLAQKDKSQRPSPPAQAQCKFSDGKTISIDYSSPRAKGRKIFGELVPFGEVWRTGANEATTFVNTANVTVGSLSVPAGNYTLFAVPNKDKWSIIINKKTGEWGIPYKYESDELGRADMMVSSTPSAVENFTIAFDQSGSSCKLKMSWENTQASIDIKEK